MDERGSILQRLIYDLTCELYGSKNVIYEFVIADLNQRIDIFITSLGIAIEIHGQQHYKYISFFFKDEFAWNNSVALDEKKAKYLNEKGIKLVEIPYNTKIKTSKDLKKLIDSIAYPENEYEVIESISQTKKDRLEKQREYRKKLYQKFKNKE